jgi:hypothetical protein
MITGEYIDLESTVNDAVCMLAMAKMAMDTAIDSLSHRGASEKEHREALAALFGALVTVGDVRDKLDAATSGESQAGGPWAAVSPSDGR